MQPGTWWFSSSKLGLSVVLAGVAYSVVASFTQPFTIGADIVTAVPLGLAAVLFGIRLRWPSRSQPRATEASEPRGQAREGAPAMSTGTRAEPVGSFDRRSLVWLGMAGVVLGWELFAYTQTPRHAHPTLSSLIDMVDATQVGRTLMFALWLLLGCYLILQ
jgi:hypothetical protein